MSLDKCLRRAGKAIDQKDADFLMQKRGEYIDNGLNELEADRLAIRDLDDQITRDLDDIASLVEQSGGKVQRQEQQPAALFVERDGELVDANAAMKEIEDEIKGLDDVIRCTFGGAK